MLLALLLLGLPFIVASNDIIMQAQDEFPSSDTLCKIATERRLEHLALSLTASAARGDLDMMVDYLTDNELRLLKRRGFRVTLTAPKSGEHVTSLDGKQAASSSIGAFFIDWSFSCTTSDSDEEEDDGFLIVSNELDW